MEKQEIRKRIRELKKQYSPQAKAEKSQTVWEQLEGLPAFRKARTVLAYWSMPDEIATHDFVCKWAERETVLLPCVCGNELEIRRFENREKLCAGEKYAIPEPTGEIFTALNQIDVILVPGMAFDRLKNRLGRGKGYYDRILKRTKACKIGLCYDFQLLDHLPTEEHDVKMDTVICSR